MRKAIKACGARHATAEVETVCGAAARHAPQATKRDVLRSCGGSWWFTSRRLPAATTQNMAFCIIAFLTQPPDKARLFPSFAPAPAAAAALRSAISLRSANAQSAAYAHTMRTRKAVTQEKFLQLVVPYSPIIEPLSLIVYHKNYSLSTANFNSWKISSAITAISFLHNGLSAFSPVSQSEST